MTTLASIARNENFVHLTVTPSPVPGPNDVFPESRTYYRWDVAMLKQGMHPSIPVYTELINHISMGYGNPILNSMPLADDAGFEEHPDLWTESIYIEATDEMPCPSFVEDGSCIHSEHTR